MRVLALFRAAAVVAAVASAAGSSPASAQQTTAVLGASSRSFNPGFANMWIGGPLGLFGNVTPEVAGTSGASENLQLMLAGQITMSTGTQDVAFASIAEGRKLPVIIPCVYLRGNLHRVSVLPDSPIKDYAGLKGMKVGVPTLAYGGIGYLKFALRHAGISDDDINLVAVGDGQAAAAALTSKRIDALTNADVDVARLQKLGVAVRVLEPPESVRKSLIAYVYMFRKPWYQEHKTEALAILQGLIRSIIVLTENPEAAVKISYFMHPESVPSGISREQAIRNEVDVIKLRAPLIVRNSAGTDKWCDFPKEAWTDFVDILGLKGKVDASEFYTDELIAKINAFDEDKFRAWVRDLKVPDSDADIAAWLKQQKPPL
jgi:ABC-type nitrate/sulfonate/bicarbonate transport system substrate-binding protein